MDKRTARILAFVLSVWVPVGQVAAQPAGGPPAGMPGGMAAAPIEVGYVELEPQTLPLTTVLPGRVAASAVAEVRPQVSGIITSVAVEEGQPVKVGDRLFTIDDKNYRAEVAAAEASLASANAQLPSAQSKLSRYETLAKSGSVSEAELDTVRVELAQAEAAVQSAEAALRLKQISLEQAQITAPIAGLIGTRNADIGSLVTAGQADPLTTIRTIDPVHVLLVESSVNLLKFRPDETVAGEPSPPPSPPVTLTLGDGRVYGREGTISSADLIVSETTGTVTMRATVPNPDMVLLPGMFVRAHIKIGEQQGVYLVPQRAVTFNSRGEPTAYFVSADNKAEQRVLTATRDVNNAWVVTSGVNPGDRLIVDGLQKINDGSVVNPVEVTISDDGVIHQDMGGAARPPGGSAAPAGAPEGQKPAATPEGQEPASAPEGQQPASAQPPAEKPAPQPEGATSGEDGSR